MANSWVERVKKAEKTGLVQNNRHKIHYTFSDDAQMVEEYDLNSKCLVVRKWKRKTTLGGTTDWDLEVGEDLIPQALLSSGDSTMQESTSNPKFVRLDTVDGFRWRIRNLPYPIDTYSVSIEGMEIVLRTSNKKYFKRFKVPDLDRMELPYDEKALKLAHANNTLIISYKKPKQVLIYEKILQTELAKLDASQDGGMHDCKMQ